MSVERLVGIGWELALVQPACRGRGCRFRRGVRLFKGRAIDRRCH